MINLESKDTEQNRPLDIKNLLIECVTIRKKFNEHINDIVNYVKNKEESLLPNNKPIEEKSVEENKDDCNNCQ